MDKLEAAEHIWNTVTAWFDKIESQEKKEWFNNIVDQIEENKWVQKLKETRKTMTEKQKLEIYKRHSISVNTWLRYGLMTTYWAGEKLYHGIKNVSKEWIKNAANYATIEEIPCRFLVQLGILDKPEWLDNDKLTSDIQKDAKNFDLYLNMCEKLCMVVPDAQAAVPFIKIARHYTKRYKKEWSAAVIERLAKKKEEAVTAQASAELVETMSDVKAAA